MDKLQLKVKAYKRAAEEAVSVGLKGPSLHAGLHPLQVEISNFKYILEADGYCKFYFVFLLINERINGWLMDDEWMKHDGRLDDRWMIVG